MQILQRQLSSNFEYSLAIDKSSSSDKSDISVENPSFWFNPFSSSDSSSSNSSPQTLTGDASMTVERFECTLCTKDFSQAEFLQFHKECFHKTALVTAVRYVEELMTSFDGENVTPEASNIPTKVQQADKKSTKQTKRLQQSKEAVKKSLRSQLK